MGMSQLGGTKWGVPAAAGAAEGGKWHCCKMAHSLYTCGAAARCGQARKHRTAALAQHHECRAAAAKLAARHLTHPAAPHIQGAGRLQGGKQRHGSQPGWEALAAHRQPAMLSSAAALHIMHSHPHSGDRCGQGIASARTWIAGCLEERVGREVWVVGRLLPAVQNHAALVEAGLVEHLQAKQCHGQVAINLQVRLCMQRQQPPAAPAPPMGSTQHPSNAAARLPQLTRQPHSSSLGTSN